MHLLLLIGLLFVGALQDLVFAASALAAPDSPPSAESAPSLATHQPESMLDCARLTDTAKKLSCFDRVKSKIPDVSESKNAPQKQVAGEPKLDRSRDADKAGTSSAFDSSLAVPRSKRKTPAQLLSDFALEVVRQLGKEMRPEEYPIRAREQGIGGTVHALLRIGVDGGVADAMIESSSGNNDLDQYVVDKLSNLRLPPIPAEFRARAFAVQILVKFAVRDN